MPSASDSESIGPSQRPIRLFVATTILVLMGVAFVAAAVILIYGATVNAAAVAGLFALVALVLLGIAAFHFAAARWMWLRARWADLLGIVISLIGVLLLGYVGIDQLLHSDDARDGAPYLIVAIVYAVCLVSLLTIGAAFVDHPAQRLSNGHRSELH